MTATNQRSPATSPSQQWIDEFRGKKSEIADREKIAQSWKEKEAWTSGRWKGSELEKFPHGEAGETKTHQKTQRGGGKKRRMLQTIPCELSNT